MQQHPAQWRTIVSHAARSYDRAACAHHTITATVKPGRGDAALDPDTPIQHMCYACGRVFKHRKGV
eukprot:11990372-Alexandrium_andersonii.AAC.1